MSYSSSSSHNPQSSISSYTAWCIDCAAAMIPSSWSSARLRMNRRGTGAAEEGICEVSVISRPDIRSPYHRRKHSGGETTMKLISTNNAPGVLCEIEVIAEI